MLTPEEVLNPTNIVSEIEKANVRAICVDLMSAFEDAILKISNVVDKDIDITISDAKKKYTIEPLYDDGIRNYFYSHMSELLGDWYKFVYFRFNVLDEDGRVKQDANYVRIKVHHDKISRSFKVVERRM